MIHFFITIGMNYCDEKYNFTTKMAQNITSRIVLSTITISCKCLKVDSLNMILHFRGLIGEHFPHVRGMIEVT